MSIIDLRSDTVTKPSFEMRRAMAEAEVGDDVYQEDPTVIKLEQLAAEITGQEAALFVCSGTMGNIVSLLTHCNRGDGVILGYKSHIYVNEGGGLSALGGLVPLCVNDGDGIPKPEEVLSFCRPENVHYAPAKLLCLENTHNACGGVAISPEDFLSMVSLAKNRGLSVHLDGARIFNAAIAWGVEPIVYTESVDSVQFCLSKGLGAPIGSLIFGSKDYIRRARHWRKRVGGGLRQAGVIAAAGIIALRNYPDLRHDHEKAKILKDRLTSEGVKVVEVSKPTNMVYFDVESSVDEALLAEKCSQRGVLFNPTPEKIRLVTHRDVSFEDVEKAAKVIAEELCRLR
ncbi:MAG: low-specificity L-threonine aldolase [Acetomicrobium sp.]